MQSMVEGYSPQAKRHGASPSVKDEKAPERRYQLIPRTKSTNARSGAGTSRRPG